MYSQIDTIKVSVAANGTVSSVGNAEGGMLLRVSIPDAVSTSFKIQTACLVNGTLAYQPEYATGADLSYTCADNKNVNVAGDNIICNEFKLVFSSTETSAIDVYVQVLRL